MTERYLLIGLIFFSVVIFWALNRRRGYHDLRTFLDSYIPFLPIFVVPYLGLFVYIGIAMYLLFSTWLAIQYYTALSGAMLSATFVWYMLPAKMFRPRVLPVGIFERLVFEVYRGDPHANAFPSSHVFTSTITAYYLSLYAPELSPLIWILGASIAVSTVFIKQHHAVDFLAGLVWAYGVIAVVSRFVV